MKNNNNLMYDIKTIINDAKDKGVDFEITNKSLIIKFDKEGENKHEILFT